MIQKDELNKLQKPSKRTKKKAMPYDEYFGDMALDGLEIEERISFANLLDGVIFEVLLLIGKIIEDGIENQKSVLYNKLTNGIEEVMCDYDSELLNDNYVYNHIRELVWDVVDVAFSHPNDPYYTSYDRAMFIAENEANTFANYRQEQKAISSGKTKKRWISMNDRFVRDSHSEVDGEEIPIDELFQVGDSLMAFPKDLTYSPNPEDVINCRCSCEYID